MFSIMQGWDRVAIQIFASLNDGDAKKRCSTEIIDRMDNMFGVMEEFCNLKSDISVDNFSIPIDGRFRNRLAPDMAKVKSTLDSVDALNFNRDTLVLQGDTTVLKTEVLKNILKKMF